MTPIEIKDVRAGMIVREFDTFGNTDWEVLENPERREDFDNCLMLKVREIGSSSIDFIGGEPPYGPSLYLLESE